MHELEVLNEVAVDAIEMAKGKWFEFREYEPETHPSDKQIVVALMITKSGRTTARVCLFSVLGDVDVEFTDSYSGADMPTVPKYWMPLP